MRLVLPSNASLNYFPNNTLTSFTVQLAETLDLPYGEWHIGLAEIQFYKSWLNVKQSWIRVQIDDGQYRKLTIPTGYYAKVTDIMTKINNTIEEKLPNHRGDVAFSYDATTRRVEIMLSISKNITVELETSLSQILGFKHTVFHVDLVQQYPSYKNTYGAQIFYSTAPVDLAAGLHNIYVYCDLADMTIVGDTLAPLLRIVPVQSDHWVYQFESFNKIQYVPLAKHRTKTITVYLRSASGEPIQFTSGHTVVTLDIRRVKSLHTY